jgi:hypothetical protein
VISEIILGTTFGISVSSVLVALVVANSDCGGVEVAATTGCDEPCSPEVNSGCTEVTSVGVTAVVVVAVVDAGVVVAAITSVEVATTVGTSTTVEVDAGAGNGSPWTTGSVCTGVTITDSFVN